MIVLAVIALWIIALSVAWIAFRLSLWLNDNPIVRMQ